MDLTPEPELPTAEPFRHGETLTPPRAEAVFTAAAAELLSVGSDLVPGWMGSAVGRWLIGLADTVGVTGSDISDEMLGGLALANTVLRAREGDPAYRAGREDAARDIEAAVVAGAAIPAWATPSGVPTARAIRAWAASLARGNQPRTIQEPSPSEHTQDGGEPIKVTKFAHYASLAEGTCESCSQPLLYNMAYSSPMLRHVDEASTCTDPYPAIPKRGEQ